MKLDDILSEWKQDSKIDDTDLSKESLKSSTLHAKYYEIFSNEKLILAKLESDYKQLLKIKVEYYRGRLSGQELSEYGWEPFLLKLVNKEDYQLYIDSDKDVINLLLKITIQKEKTEALKDIIRAIHSRPYIIKNSIDFIKFSSGF